MRIIPNPPIYVIVNSFSDRKERLPKHMTIAQTIEPPSVIHTINTDDREASPIETAEANINLKFNALHGHADVLASQQTDVSAVYRKAAKSWDSQISWHTDLDEAPSQNVQD